MQSNERREWLEWRTRGIGASDVAGILGNSPWASPYSVWFSKVGPPGEGGQSANAEAMRWGGLLEDAILDETARRLDIEIISRQERVELADWPVARATLDGRYYSLADPADHGVIEVKTTSTPRWYEVPEYYEAQIQWQLMITGEPRAWLPCLHMGRRLSIWQIEADPEIGKGLLEIVQNFWERYVCTGTAPEVDAAPATTDAITARYSSPEVGEVVDISPLAGTVDKLRNVREEIKQLGNVKDALENTIKNAIGDHGEAAAVDGEIVATWKKSLRTQLDFELIREKYPRESAECTVRVPRRTFLLKEAKNGAQ
jgi:putative phage-type endonuclease